MNIIEMFRHANRTVRIIRDEDPPHPLSDFDNVSVMVCWHRKYDLGHKNVLTKAERNGLVDRFGEAGRDNFEGVFRDFLTERGETVLAMLPLYLYDHSGLSIATGDFGDKWDSGWVGFAYVTKDSAEKMGCVGSEWTTEKYEESIRREVQQYDQYLRGGVYAYEILGMDGDVIDSCYGIYGDVDDATSEAKGAAEHSSDPVVLEMAEAMASRVTYASVVSVDDEGMTNA